MPVIKSIALLLQKVINKKNFEKPLNPQTPLTLKPLKP